jgi:2,3-bisphosphoglycerate-dependent phosphoglycerate mutase
MYVSRALEMPLLAWPEIHELGGIFLEGEDESTHKGLPGKPRTYFVEKYTQLVLPDALTDEGWWNRPFEAHEARPLRAQRVLEMLHERHGRTNDHVAIVSHGGFYMELMRAMFKIAEPMSWFLMNNTAVTRIDFRDSGEMVLVYHNRTDHLPAELIT